MICYCIFPKFPEYNSNLTLTDDVIFVNQLKGAIVYYDGSHNDSRMCISIAVTAARLGATVANHTRDTIQQTFLAFGDSFLPAAKPSWSIRAYFLLLSQPFLNSAGNLLTMSSKVKIR